MDYFLPSDVDKANYMFRPLVRNKSQFEMLDTICNTFAFYEAIADKLREIKGGQEANQLIGHELEELIRNEFSQCHIPVIRGKYQMGEISGECDAVVESPETLIFLELKSKSLTRASMSGNPVQVLVDLSQSLVDSQLQLGRHEMLIRQNGEILFDGGRVLELNDRDVERVAITLLDFGGLQVRSVLMQFLSLMTRASFEADGPLDERGSKNPLRNCKPPA